MKLIKIIPVIFLAISVYGQAQVIIGDAIGTSSDKTSVLLEFANTNNKGVIVPYVRTLPAGIEGSIILDATTESKARVKFFNGSWTDLSGQDADVSTKMDNGIQPTTASAAVAKAVIGDPATAPNGVLVLESTTKAMVLPHVTDVQNILNPSPGMIVYVNKSGSKRLAVFNGSKWSFWSPTD